MKCEPQTLEARGHQQHDEGMGQDRRKQCCSGRASQVKLAKE